MQTASNISRFEGLARVFSVLSVLISCGALLVRIPTPERGIEFGSHLLLGLGLLAQVGLLILMAGIALVLRIRGRLRCDRFSAGLSALAVAGLIGQFHIVQTIAVDGSSVP